MSSSIQEENKFISYLQDYWDIYVGVFCVALAFYFYHNNMDALATIVSAVAIGTLSLTVSEIAEILSERFPEPYGSFVLTASAVIVEIILLYMILLQAVQDPEVVKTVKGGIIAAVIVDMNVLLGFAVFVGGLRFVEQEHNKDTSSTYTTILLVASLALLVPSILNESNHSQTTLYQVSMILSGLLMIYYIIIVVFQTKTHTHFFKQTARSRLLRLKRKMKEEHDEEEDDDYLFDRFNNFGLIVAIFIFIAIIALSAEIFAHDGMKLAADYGISHGIAGLIIALISASPELLTAVKAAKNDEIQRVINIAMGASTVSILVTVPVLMGLAYASHINLTLDFSPLEIGALIFTIILAWKTTEEGHTNYIEGLSHLMFFAAFTIIAAYY
ncbi:sodium:proton exchanger [Sulfurimonas sp.]|uniref:calcium:proton antiporter n=1 Tax=Sulfurimonas sp. TaxID=2022749 RepID=UPI0026172577|nr:sodium:proton exchanger [Sulfurimonas sp.]